MIPAMAQSDTFAGLARVRAPQQQRSRRAFTAALAAFDALLRERPFAGVTVQEVADRAGLSITSVYARFDGKNALILALHEQVIAAGLERLGDALADPALADRPLDEVVGTIIGAAVDFAHENAHVFRAVVVSADDETLDRAAAFIRAVSERLATALGPKASESDVDFGWRATAAVLQQMWMLGGAEPSRFPLDRAALADRLTAMFLAVVS